MDVTGAGPARVQHTHALADSSERYGDWSGKPADTREAAEVGHTPGCRSAGSVGMLKLLARSTVDHRRQGGGATGRARAGRPPSRHGGPTVWGVEHALDDRSERVSRIVTRCRLA